MSLKALFTRPATVFLVATLVFGAGKPSNAQLPAVLPDTGEDTEPWATEIAQFKASDRISPPPTGGVLFIGSSSIRLWPDIDYAFPRVDVVKRGFGGALLSDIIYRAPAIVLPYRPRLIILYAGDNDIAAGRQPSDVFQDYQRFVALVRDSLPNTGIAFLSIKPSAARWELVQEIRATNTLVRQYAAAHTGLLYIDVFTPMLGPDGLPRAELFTEDKLHMNAEGYALWRDILRPIVAEYKR